MVATRLLQLATQFQGPRNAALQTAEPVLAAPQLDYAATYVQTKRKPALAAPHLDNAATDAQPSREASRNLRMESAVKPM